ncbi:unnamed protein product [Adineta steineri]|uniref:Double-strand-break repair protein rad21-like protein n=2 Tax=Adineta steineri TaxID=433720 RepID=A0A818JK52_9BILA|nr:unnamed protein product [Adineta steineri]CAF3544201.1 unnamed protein product [Adineta steineri]CAF3834054.1 unnamed protein product [Adineta steineri]CAF3834269.1 unnamed protein product [Adineta steineri]
MFYTHAILTKRGPLARLWLAAHWDKKLTKAQIFETDIRLSCESILEPCLKLALRTKGHLLLGVVRIYSRKTKYLLADCNEAFIKIKMAFRPGIVGIDGSNNHHAGQDSDTREVSIAAITLPENFHDFDLIDLNIDYIDDPSRFQIHQARAEEITLKEDFISVPMPLDDDFGDANGLDEPEFFRKLQPSLHFNAQNSNLDIDNTIIRKEQSMSRPLGDDPFALDGFGDFAAPASVIGIGGDNSNLSNERDQYDHVMSPFHQDENAPGLPSLDDHQAPANDQNQDNNMDMDPAHIPGVDDTTLLSNVSDEFVLPPISTAAQTSTVRQAVRRKRKLVIDETKEIDSGAMKTQLSDTTDIVGVLELAPPTRRLMHLKETGGIEKLFSLSATSIYAKTLQQLITRNMITKSLDQMAPDNYQIQHDLAMEQLERERDESSIDQMRATHHHYLEVLGHDPSFMGAGGLSPNRSKKRGLSPHDDDNLIKHQRSDALLFPPMTTSMDNLMDVIPGPMSPTRKSGRKVHELNQLPPSPSRTPGNMRRKKGMGHLTKENQEEQDDEEEEHGQTTTTAQEDFESGKKLNRRGKIMLNAFERAFDSADALSFHDHLSSGNPNYHTRKLTAQKFYTLLVLKKLQAVDVEQTEAFGDVMITPGVHFHQYMTSGGR